MMKNSIIILGAVLLMIILTAIIYIGLDIKNVFKNIPVDQSRENLVVSPSVLPRLSLIYVDKPVSGQLLSSSKLEVSGQARGNWYFEASFPVRIYDADGLELGVAIAQAQGEWMTTEFVPFIANLSFKKPSTPKGILVLQKDNPSGLAEYDDELRIPVNFDLTEWTDEPVSDNTEPAKCKVTGCSGQVCAEEDVTTTCEFKPEYACYKSAKCERQNDGKCGWSPSEELVACLYSAWGAEPELQ